MTRKTGSSPCMAENSKRPTFESEEILECKHQVKTHLTH